MSTHTIRIPHCVIPNGAKVLVTGATGFTGQHLVKKLLEQGADVRAIARESSDLTAFRNLPITWFRGEVFDEKTIADAVQGIEYIFHVAAAFREAKVADEFYVNVHVVSTKRLAERARRQPGFRRFVHVSTVGVLGHIENPPADENTPLCPGDIYQSTKADAEVWIREFAASSGLPLTVIRPAAIYGPGDMRLLKVFRMASKKTFPILGHSKGLYHLIHVDDLTDIMILSASSAAAVGEVFIAGNPAALPLERIARIIAESYGNDSLRVMRLPAWPFFVAGAICEVICKPLGIEPPIYRRRVAFFTKDRSFRTTKLRETLGYTGARSDEEGLRETARWYLKHGYVRLPDGSKASIDRAPLDRSGPRNADTQPAGRKSVIVNNSGERD